MIPKNRSDAGGNARPVALDAISVDAVLEVVLNSAHAGGENRNPRGHGLHTDERESFVVGCQHKSIGCRIEGRHIPALSGEYQAVRPARQKSPVRRRIIGSDDQEADRVFQMLKRLDDLRETLVREIIPHKQ